MPTKRELAQLRVDLNNGSFIEVMDYIVGPAFSQQVKHTDHQLRLRLKRAKQAFGSLPALSGGP